MEYETEVRQHLFLRVLWSLVWTFMIRPFPRNMASKWEIFLLRLFGAKIGKGCVIYSSASIWFPKNLILEDNVLIADHVIIQNSKPLFLKKGATISQYSYICDGNHYVENLDEGFARSITLGEYCWVGAQSYVGCGVSIGRGCMVGARTVVRSKVPEYSIVIGNPCKVVGFRFTPEEIIDRELKVFEESERLSFEYLKDNYKKYFSSKAKDIKKYLKIAF